jgi:hypothetical protein
MVAWWLKVAHYRVAAALVGWRTRGRLGLETLELHRGHAAAPQWSAKGGA